MDSNTGIGYFDEIKEFQQLPDSNLRTQFQSPFQGGITTDTTNPADLPKLMQPATSMEAAINSFKNSQPSFQTRSAPVFFDYDKSQAERFVSSDYYKELGFNPFGDNESKYGYRQSFGNMMKNAIGGAGKLAWNTFVDGWKGWSRLTNAVMNLDLSELMGSEEELHELDKEQKAIFNKYAIYRTPESEESIFNKQFLGDLIQQSGFSIGTMAQVVTEELLTMGMGTFLKPLTGAATVAKIGRAGITFGELNRDMARAGNILKERSVVQKIFDNLKTVGEHLPVSAQLIELGSDVSRGINQGDNFWSLTSVTFNGLRRTLSEANMAMTEARMEAAGTYGELREQLYDQVLQEKGMVSWQDLQEIEAMSQQAAWKNFMVNTVTIAAMNRLQFDNLFTSFGSSRRIFRQMSEQGENVFSVTGKAVNNVTDKSGKVIIQKGSPYTKVYEKGSFGKLGQLGEISRDFGGKTAFKQGVYSLATHALKMELAEGAQEIIQETSNKAVLDYYTKAFKDQPNSWTQSVSHGLDSQLSTEGLKVFLSGALTGKILSPLTAMVQKTSSYIIPRDTRNEIKVSRKNALNVLNAFLANPSRYAPKWAENTRIQGELAKSMEEAVQQDSKYYFENAKDDAFAQAISASRQLGMLDTLIDTIEQVAEHFNEKEFREAFGIDFTDQNRGNVRLYAGKVADEIKAFSKRLDKLEDKYSSLINPEVYQQSDRKKIAVIQRAFQEALGILATTEYIGGRSVERWTSIMQDASKLPGIEKSAYHAFRILSDEPLLDKEIELLKANIKADKEGTLTEEIKQRIDSNQKQLDALESYKKTKDLIKTDDVGIDTKLLDSLNDSLVSFLAAKNEELGITDAIPQTSLDELMLLAEDFRKLRNREKHAIDAHNLIASPKKFIALFERIYGELADIPANINTQVQIQVNSVNPSDSTLPTQKNDTDTIVSPPTELPSSTTSNDQVTMKAGQIVVEHMPNQSYINPVHGLRPVTYRIRIFHNESGIVEKVEYFRIIPPNAKVEIMPLFFKNLNAQNFLENPDVLRFFSVLAQYEYFSRLSAGALNQKVTHKDEKISQSDRIRRTTTQIIPPVIENKGKDVLISSPTEDILNEFLIEQIFDPHDKEDIKENYSDLANAIKKHLVQPLEAEKKKFFYQALAEKKESAGLFKLDGRQAIKVFSIESRTQIDLQKLFREVPLKEFHKKVSFRVSRNNNQSAPRLLKSIGSEEIWIYPSPLNIELLYEGKVIGYLSHPDVLRVKKGNEIKTLGEITKNEFDQVFDSNSSHSEVKAAYDSGTDLINQMEVLLGKEETVLIDNNQLNQISYFQYGLGEYDFTQQLFSLQDIQAAGNKLVAIVDKRIADQPFVMPSSLKDTQHSVEQANQIISQYQVLNKTARQGRYIAVLELPNGSFRFVELVSSPLSPAELDQLYDQITERIIRTVGENVQRDEKSKKIAVDSTFNRHFNEVVLPESMFLAFPPENKGVYVNIEITPTGDLQVAFFEQGTKSEKSKIYVNNLIRKEKIRVGNFLEMLDLINQSIVAYNQKHKKDYPVLKPEFFKQVIPSNANYQQLQGLVTNVSPSVVKNINLYAYANTMKVVSPVETTHQLEPQKLPKTKRSGLLGGVDMETLKSTEKADISSDELKPVGNSLEQIRKEEEIQKEALRKKYEDSNGIIKDIAGYTAELKKLELDFKQKKQLLVKNQPSKKNSLKSHKGFVQSDVDDIDSFFAWAEKNLPEFISIENLNTVEQKLAHGNILLGRFNTWMKTIEIGPENAYKYHEAFHAIFRLLLTDTEIDQVLLHARYEVSRNLHQQGKSIEQGIVEFVAENPVYKLADPREQEDLFLEEWLADQFHSYRQRQLVDASEKKNENLVIKFFKKLLSFLRIIKRSRQSVPWIFRQIDKGAFRNSQVVDNRFTREVGELNQLVANKIAYDEDYVTGTNGQVSVVKKYLSESDTSRIVGGIVNTFLKRADAQKSFNKRQLLEEILDSYQKLYLGKSYSNLTADQVDRLEVFKKVFSEQGPRMDIIESADRFLRMLGFDQEIDSDEFDFINDDLGDRRTTEDWDETHSFGGFKSLSSYVRQYIQSTAYEGADEFGNMYLDETTSEPMLTGVNAGIVYNGLLKISAGITSATKFIKRLELFKDENLECRAFVEKFISDTGLQWNESENSYTAYKDPRLFNAVFKSFSMFQVDYMTLRIDPGTGMDIKLSNRRDAASNQYSRWQNAFVFNYQDQAPVNSHLKKELLKTFRSLLVPFQMQQTTLTHELNEYLDVQLAKLRNITGIKISRLYYIYSVLFHLKENSVILTPDQQDILDSFDDVEPITQEDVIELTKTIAADENPFINFDRIQEDELADPRMNPVTDVEKDTLTDLQDLVIGDNEIAGTIGKGNETRLRRLAKNNAVFDETVLATSWVNSQGKTVWSHQLPTYHLTFIEEFIKDPVALARLIKSDSYLQGTYFGKQVINPEETTEEVSFDQIAPLLKLKRIEGMRQVTATAGRDGRLVENRRLESNKREGVTYGDFDDREFMLALIGLYMEPETISVRHQEQSRKITTTRHLIRVLEASNTGDTINLPVIRSVERQKDSVKLSADARKIIGDIIENEYNRIRAVARSIHEDKTGQQEITQWIADYNDYQEAGSKLRGLKFWNLSDFLGPLSTTLEESAQQDFLNPLSEADKETAINRIEESLLGNNGQVDMFISIMEAAGIIENNGKGGWNNKLLSPYFFGTKRQMPQRFQSLHLGGTLRANVAQFFINDFINTLSINELLLGDQARGLKDFIDAVKRAKGANASGPNLSSDIIAPQLGIHEVFDKSYVHIHKDDQYLGTYSGVMQKRTDAQMWTTIKAHRYIEFSLGRLTSKEADFIDRLELGLMIEPEEIFGSQGSIKNNIQASVKKVVYYDGSQYIKTSMFVLTKRFTSYLKNEVKEKVDKLLEISRGQITQEIRELCSDNANWLPRPGREVLHNKRVMLEEWEIRNKRVAFSIPESAAKLMRVNVGKDLINFSDGDFSELDNRFWRLQSENPTNKVSITDPTQGRQIVDTEQGPQAAVRELMEQYQSDSARRITLKYSSARDQIFEIEELESELSSSIDQDKVTPRLAVFLQHVQHSLQQSGASSQLLELFSVTTDPQTGEPVARFDLNHPYTVKKFIQLFLAYFRKDVMSEKVPGHALTLVSDFGMKVIKKVKRVDQSGMPIEWDVIQSHVFESNPDSYSVTKELGKDTFEPGDLFIDELRFNVPQYNHVGEITGYFTEYMMPPHFRELMELGNASIPEALLYAFGVRIPSQDKHSLFSLKLVDFLPAEYGSMGIFPKEMIEISGADFDVDKLYIQITSFFTQKNKNKHGKTTTEWVRFGSNATTIKEQYEQYLHWHRLNNPYLKDAVRQISLQHEKLHEHESKLLELLAQKRQLTREFDNNKTAKEHLVQQIGELNNAIDQVESRIENVNEEIKNMAMIQAGIILDVQEFQDRLKSEGELNVGVLNNRLLDAKIQLLTNQHQQENGIPFQVANLKPLEEVERDARVQPGVITEMNLQVDTPLGKTKSFGNNQEGKSNIAPAVNAMLSFTFLNKYGIKFRDRYAKNKLIYKLSLNGHTFDGYSNTKSAQFDESGNFIGYNGPRILNVISAIITAMTDNAKERKAAKLNLNIDAVSIASNMVAQGFPKEETIALLLSKPVKEYYDIIRQQRYAIRKDAFKATETILTELLEKYQLQSKQESIVPVALTSKMLFDNLKQEYDDPIANYSLLYHFGKIREQSDYFMNIAQILKLSKGLGAELEFWDDIKRKCNQLGVFENDSTFELNEVPFDIRDAIWNKHHMSATYLKIGLQIEELSKSMILVRSKLFTSVRDATIKQLDVPLYLSNRYNKNLENAITLFFGLTAYIQQLHLNGSDLLYYVDNRLIHDTDKKDFQNIIQILNEGKRLAPENSLLKFLHANPTTLVEKGKVVPNPNNTKGVNLIEANTWAKLDAYQLEKLQNGFIDLYSNEKTRKVALALFAYTIVKDGTLFKNDSLLPFLPAFMLEELLGEVMVNVRNIFKRDQLQQYIDLNPDYAQRFKEVFGSDFKGMVQKFYDVFLTHVSNSYYVRKVSIIGTPAPGANVPLYFSGDVNDVRQTIVVDLFDKVRKKIMVQIASQEGITWQQAISSQKTLDPAELKTFYENKEELKKNGFPLQKKNGKWLVQLPYIIKVRRAFEGGYDYYKLETAGIYRNDKDTDTPSIESLLDKADWQIWASRATYRRTTLKGTSAQTALSGLFGEVPAQIPTWRKQVFGYSFNDLGSNYNKAVQNIEDLDELAFISGAISSEELDQIKKGGNPSGTPGNSENSKDKEQFAGYTPDFFGEPSSDPVEQVQDLSVPADSIAADLAKNGYTFKTIKGRFKYWFNDKPFEYVGTPAQLLEQLHKQNANQKNKSGSGKTGLLGGLDMQKLRSSEEYIPDSDDKLNPLNCKGNKK